jgi:glycosyltransferase involved in cell wall biosynthesis
MHNIQNKKVIHIAEAFGGGVLNVVSQLARSQITDNFDVYIIYSVRHETPPEKELSVLFPPPIVRIKLLMKANISPIHDFVSMLRILKIFLTIRPDIIHLHSSKAGALGRMAAWLVGFNKRVFYSPHGLSFLRQDVSKTKRIIYLIIERLFAHLGGIFIASCKTEADLAKYNIKHKKIVVVENSIPLVSLIKKNKISRKKLKVVTSGRICFAKAPWKFIELANRLNNEFADFIWIGDGELKNKLLIKENIPSNLKVLGWKNRDDVFKELANSDIFILLSLWEGMPLSLIEAQAIGLPAVVSDVVGCRDIVINGETGYVCSDIDEVVSKVQLLIRNIKLRKTLGKNAFKLSRLRFSPVRMHKEILAVYSYAQL